MLYFRLQGGIVAVCLPQIVDDGDLPGQGKSVSTG